MSGMLSQWMSALRDSLHLSAIERDIVKIRNETENQDLRTGAGQALLANQQQNLDGIMHELAALVADERVRREGAELKLSGSVVELANETTKLCTRQQHLEGTIDALGGSMRELAALVAGERVRREGAELKLSGLIAELTNEIRRLSDVVDEHLRTTTLKQHDK